MSTSIAAAIKKQKFPLADLIDDGCGFRIGSPEIKFLIKKQNQNTWKHFSEDGSLELKTELNYIGNQVIISHTLKNISGKVTGPIDVLEPLSIVFSHRSKKWRHIFANGGTTEHFYPPSAYRTHDRTLCERPIDSKFTTSLRIESHPEGRSSNLHLPFLFSLKSADLDSEGLFCGLEWSAGWYVKWDKVSENKASLSAGVKINGIKLNPEEELKLPNVHLGFYEGGSEGATNALRNYLYKYICPKYQGEKVIPKVSYDTWFNIKDELNGTNIMAQIETASKLGIEVFVVDAAWFKGGFNNGIGTWEVDKVKFPDGLEPVAEYVRSNAMDFGLWFEPERVFENTMLQKQHPEWLVHIGNKSDKKLYHLNLANREAQDFVIDMISKWVERLDIRWIRWDYNIEPKFFWEQVDPTLKIQFDYMEGLYRVRDTLLQCCPNLMIEGCASGGRRLDIGTIKRSHTFWFSDQTDQPQICRYMQARANRFLPGNLLNSSVAVSIGQGDSDFNDTSILSRMLGKLAFDGDIASWSAGMIKQMGLYVAEFKSIRHLMVQDFYQLLDMPTSLDSWDAVEFTSYDKEEAAVFVFAGSNGGCRNIYPKGLEFNYKYVLKQCSERNDISILGSELLSNGFSVELGPNEGSLYHIIKSKL